MSNFAKLLVLALLAMSMHCVHGDDSSERLRKRDPTEPTPTEGSEGSPIWMPLATEVFALQPADAAALGSAMGTAMGSAMGAAFGAALSVTLGAALGGLGSTLGTLFTAYGNGTMSYPPTSAEAPTASTSLTSTALPSLPTEAAAAF
jgi:hypothetical protein